MIILQMAEIRYHFHLHSLLMRKLATLFFLPCPWGKWRRHQGKEGKYRIVQLCHVVVNELNS